MLKPILKSPKRLLSLAKRVTAWYVNRAVDDAPRPLSCGIYLTNRCNLRCQMCNIFRHPDKGLLDESLYRKLVEGLGRVGCYYLSFSGGEPTLDPNLTDRIRFAKSHVPYVHMVTNGVTLTERMIREIRDAGLDEISISIDGLAPIHDSIRGVKGAFEKTMRALDLWMKVAPQVPVVVNTVFTPRALNTLMDLAVIIRKKGLMHKFQPVNRHPEFEGMTSTSEEFVWDRSDVDRAREFLTAVSKWPNVANSSYFLSQIPSYLSRSVDHGLFRASCQYAYHHIEVTSDGLLFPCLTAAGWQDGFKLEGELEDLLASKEYRALARRLRNCKGCRDNMYICNFEPRIVFPLTNYVKYQVAATVQPVT